MCAHAPTPPRWVRDAVFYQIFPDRFAASDRLRKPGPLEPWDTPPTAHGFKGGDLLGIVERLDELADLGITALYLTPIFRSASNHRYHTDDYLEVDPMLGGDAAARELIDALHARGMRIVLDGVFNHCGRGFWPFHHVAENGLHSPYREWFRLDHDRLASGHGLQPYWERAKAAVPDPGAFAVRGTGYAAWWNLPALPKLDTDHPSVREYLWSVGEHWLRFGIDGWRLDVPAEIEDRGFWQEFRRRARAVNPDAYLVGEIWEVEPEWLEGDRFDALMNYPLLDAILSFVGGESLDTQRVAEHHELRKHVRATDAASFAARLTELHSVYGPQTVASQLNLLSSHDMPRFLTLVNGDTAAFRLATLLQMSLPGAPCVYYGDEVGMEGGNDPDCRRGFPTSAQGRDEALRDSVRALISHRRSHPALRADRVAVLYAEGQAIVLDRGGAEDASAEGERMLVSVNAASRPGELMVESASLTGARLCPIAIAGFAQVASAVADAQGRATLVLPARSAALFEVNVSRVT